MEKRVNLGLNFFQNKTHPKTFYKCIKHVTRIFAIQKKHQRSIINVVQNVESCCQNRCLKSPFLCFQTDYPRSHQGRSLLHEKLVQLLPKIQVNVPAVPVRFFSPTPTAIQEVADRIFYILSLFDKIDQEKLSLDCRFDKVSKFDLIVFRHIQHNDETFIFRIWDWTVQIQLKLPWQSRMNFIWRFQLKLWTSFWNVLDLAIDYTKLKLSQR